jgi:hypothetical protein
MADSTPVSVIPLAAIWVSTICCRFSRNCWAAAVFPAGDVNRKAITPPTTIILMAILPVIRELQSTPISAIDSTVLSIDL